jgi:hypothetical protein
MVPLVVMPKSKDEGYMLLDGERRYEAAKILGLKNVPAYIIAEKLTDRNVLLRMFHIHHNREPWGPVQQCMALESMYEEIKEHKKIQSLEGEEAKVRAIATEIERRTGIESLTARDRVLFLRWPRDIKDSLYEKPSGDYHHIIEIENGIILPALRNYPEYFRRVPVDDVRRFLYEKIKANAVMRGIEVRTAAPIVKFETHKISERKKVLRIIDDLVKDRNMTYQDARDEFDREFPNASSIPPPSPRKLLTAICKLCEDVRAFDTESFSRSVKRAKANKSEILDASQALIDELKDLRTRI